MYRFTDKSIVPLYRGIDTGVALASLFLAVLLTSTDTVSSFKSFLEMRITLKNVLLLAGLTFTWPLLFNAFGLYRFDELRRPAHEFDRIARACAVGSVFAIVMTLTSETGAFSVISVVVFWCAVTLGTVCARAVGRRVLRVTASLGASTRYIIIVGNGPRAAAVYRRLRKQPSDQVLGFVDTVADPVPDMRNLPFLGPIDHLDAILVSRVVDAVYIALPVKSRYQEIEHVIRTCERIGVEARYQADPFQKPDPRPWARDVDRLVARKVVADDYRLWAKRVIDVCGAVVALVMLSPVMLAAALVVKLTSPGPVFFKQERFGFNRRRLRMVKFRTMVIDAESRQASLEALNEAQGPVFKIHSDPRLTRAGRFLRKYSIDELPQLLHVLTGEMSLVGPRPLPLRDVSRFTESSLMRRFSVKPGLTCLWQIGGRSNTSFSRWIEQDLEYIDRWSLGLDFQILAKTIRTVISGTGAV